MHLLRLALSSSERFVGDCYLTTDNWKRVRNKIQRSIVPLSLIDRVPCLLQGRKVNKAHPNMTPNHPSHCQIDFLCGCFWGQFKILRFNIEVIVWCVIQSSRREIMEMAKKKKHSTNETQELGSFWRNTTKIASISHYATAWRWSLPVQR